MSGGWRCRCGREIDPATGRCAARVRPRPLPHPVPRNSSRCSCHGWTVADLEQLNQWEHPS